jgi:hypothetical protein
MAPADCGRRILNSSPVRAWKVEPDQRERTLIQMAIAVFFM